MELGAVLDTYAARSTREAADLQRLRELSTRPEAWARTAPVHATASAIILHPLSGRVLLRWHERMQAWLQVGGHADPGETRPLDVALREAHEETGLSDLEAWPDPQQPSVIQVVIVPVPAGRGEPAHHHADVRYVLSTNRPQDATPESPKARLRWLALPEAVAEVAEENLRTCLLRVADLQRGRAGTATA
ncbi:MAG: NUDIX domain-containing protein [Chloroflexota bacterium]|nr:NUDIX domain-containing protein [Chloroflexota bacterium]